MLVSSSISCCSWFLGLLPRLHLSVDKAVNGRSRASAARSFERDLLWQRVVDVARCCEFSCLVYVDQAEYVVVMPDFDAHYESLTRLNVELVDARTDPQMAPASGPHRRKRLRLHTTAHRG